MNRIISTTAVALALILAQPVIANAAEIKVWTARAIATVLAEIGPRFERTTGHDLNVYSGLPADFDATRQRRRSHSMSWISGSGPVDSWIKDGKIIAATRSDIVRSGIGVEVRAGAPKPDIRSVEAIQACARSARREVDGVS